MGAGRGVVDWIHENITYGAGSTSTTTALDAYVKRNKQCNNLS